MIAATPARPELWTQAHARYERLSGDRGTWQVFREPTPPWHFAQGQFTLELKLTEFGHVGLFPE